MKTWSWFLGFFILLVKMPSSSNGSPQVPALFVFGDSLVDPGNNNNLLTLAKANFPPNGIDFPGGTTGRFCNGATIADHLGYLLGLGLIPAYNDPTTAGTNILQGVNFASTSAGILNETGSHLGEHVPVSYQVENFGYKILPQIQSLAFGNKRKVPTTFEDYLAKSLIFSNIGNDDFLNNYLLPFIRPIEGSIPSNFYDDLVNNYIIQLKKLYNFGARKFLVAGLAPLGCIPLVFTLGNLDTNQCYEPYNEISKRFNEKIESMVHQLNNDLPGAHILYWDLYTFTRKVVDNPSEYGFTDSHVACCTLCGKNSTFICYPGMQLCPDRSEFVFWDGFHPTEAANKILANEVYGGIIQNSYPVNVKQLIQL